VKRLAPRVALHGWSLLTVVLAGGYVAIGVSSPLTAIRWPALTGALLLLGSVWLAARSRPTAWSALVVGAVAPAITGWWSLVIPMTGALALLCGSLAIRASTLRRRA